MVVCQFFLKGDCRFGDRCRNEHPGPGSRFGGGSGGGFSGNVFGGGRQPQSNTSGNVCQHFLKGNCWYGDNCKFSHVRPNTGGSLFGGQGFGSQQSGGFGQNRNTFGSSSLSGGNNTFNRNQNRFGALSAFGSPSGPAQTSFGARPQQTQVDAQLNPAQIQQRVIKDIEEWESSKQWPLSCYTFTKDEPCFSGLLDFSPEEIRLEAYKANVDGKAAGYQQSLKELIEKSKQRRLDLKRMPTMQLQSEIRSAKTAQSNSAMTVSLGNPAATQSSNPFSGSGGTSLGLSQSLFGSSMAGTSGGTSNLSGSVSAGLFGSKPTQPTSPGGLFGTTPSSPATNPFSNPVASSTASSGLFGSAAASPAVSFGSGVQPVSGGSLFGSSTQQASSIQGAGLFGSTTSGLPTTGGTTSLFGASPVASQTSQAAQGSTGLFGSQPSGPLATGTLAPLALGTPTTVATPSTSKATCSEQDIAAFKAEKFVLGKIPECPPPPELCV